MLSYWEKSYFVHYDHIIVGAGLVGISVAIELAERYPSHRILILERGWIPSGASTRNAGFACMGSASELLDDLQHMSEEEVVHLFEQRKNGLTLLRQRLGDNAIGYQQNGSYELLRQHELGVLDHLEYLNNLLLPIIGEKAFSICNEKIQPFGFSPSLSTAMVANHCEGELNTGKMMQSLLRLALDKKIELKTGVTVERFEEELNSVAVIIIDEIRKEPVVLRAKTLCICTNAFTKELLPQEFVTPGRGQVLITQPIPHLPFKGIFHFDKGYYYFREIDGRILLGGGRNRDFDTETTTEMTLNENIQQHLETLLKEKIAPNIPIEIAQRWSGIMAFGNSKQPLVKQFSQSVFGAFRMGGMGVALGSLSAQQIATLIQQEIENRL